MNIPNFKNGSIVKVFDTQTFGAKFTKREFLIETDELDPQLLKFEFQGDFVNVLDNFCEGEMITVAYLVKGAEWNGKYFTNLIAVAIAEIVEDKVYDEFKKDKALPTNKNVQKIIDDNEQ